MLQAVASEFNSLRFHYAGWSLKVGNVLGKHVAAGSIPVTGSMISHEVVSGLPAPERKTPARATVAEW